MKNQLQIFNSPEFGRIRTVVIDGESWFVGKDVAEALDYKDYFGALKKHVDVEDKQNCQNDSFNTPRGMTIINESGLYSLILSSKLPSAKKFKRWVTSEVLPALRKSGSYDMELNTSQSFLTKKDYLKILDIISSCDNERLQYVVRILKVMGFHDTFDDSVKSSRYSIDNFTEDFILHANVENRPTAEVYTEYEHKCNTYGITPISKLVFSKVVNKILGTKVIQKKINRQNLKVFSAKTGGNKH